MLKALFRAWWKRFWNQKSKAYRNFQIGFTILTLNFAIPSLSYIFTPESAMASFAALNNLLGGAEGVVQENGSRFWRYLGAANVATLAFMCALLQWNLRRYFAVLLPLTFMKGLAATLWLFGYLDNPAAWPACLAAAILDYVTSLAFVLLAVPANLVIADIPDDELVPRPKSLT